MTVPGRIYVVIRRWTSVSLARSGTRKSSTFGDPRSTTLNTHRPSETLHSPSLILSLGTKLRFVYLHGLPQASKLNSSIQDFVWTGCSQLTDSARITVGLERLVSRAILLPEICIAQRDIRCSQVLNEIWDPSKKEPDLIESHVWLNKSSIRPKWVTDAPPMHHRHILYIISSKSGQF